MGCIMIAAARVGPESLETFAHGKSGRKDGNLDYAKDRCPGSQFCEHRRQAARVDTPGSKSH
jgi:hypothetical protein